MGNLVEGKDTVRVLGENKEFLDVVAKRLSEEMVYDEDTASVVAESVVENIKNNPEFKKKILTQLIQNPEFREKVFVELLDKFS